MDNIERTLTIKALWSRVEKCRQTEQSMEENFDCCRYVKAVKETKAAALAHFNFINGKG